MSSFNKKIILFNEILLFVQSYKFEREKIDFSEKKEAVYVYSYKERIVNLSKSCSLLFNEKRYIDSQILSRVSLESLFYMLALINDKNFLKIIIKDHAGQKIKAFNDFKNNKDIALRFKLADNDLNRYLSDLNNQIEVFRNVSDMEVRKAATIADLLNMYMSSYRLLSLAVHSKALIIQEHFNYINGLFKFKQLNKKDLAQNSLDALIPVLLIMSHYLISYANIKSNKVKNILFNFEERYKLINKKILDHNI